MSRDGKGLAQLPRLIETRSAVISVIGLGYVGLPLAVTFAKTGFNVVGVDVDESRVKSLGESRSYIQGNGLDADLRNVVNMGKFSATKDCTYAVSRSNCAIICVPTPLNKRNEPDLSFLKQTSDSVSRGLSSGMLVVVESSIYPGVTGKVVRPILESKGLRAGVDFALAHSPERIDYGNKVYTLQKIPKIVGGIDDRSTSLAAKLYETIVQASITKVTDASTAEAAKMLENAYRFVNIALVNEFAVLCERLGIDVFEVIRAASTKPFGFQPHYPGPGIGGHCIPKDPMYLAYAAKQVRLPLKIVEASVLVNTMMPKHIISLLRKKLNSCGKRLSRSKVAVIGLAYKAGTGESRRSPAIPILQALLKEAARVTVYDPLVSHINAGGHDFVSEASFEDSAKDSDALVFLTDHPQLKNIDLEKILPSTANKSIILDARNMFRREDCLKAGFLYVGLGKP